jgi:aromatic-L-amino-acid decarboxylase
MANNEPDIATGSVPPLPVPAPGAPHLSPDEFRELGHRVVDYIANYYERLKSADPPDVLSRSQPGDIAHAFPEEVSEYGTPLNESGLDFLLSDLDELIMPGLTHWQHPNFFAFFPANSSFPAILGDMLATGLAVQGMLWQTSPACTEVETAVLDQVARLIALPESFTSSDGGGVIQGTASEATLAAMVAARDRAQREDPEAELVAYTSTQAHSSIVKAAMICGIGRERVRLVGTDETLAMDPDRLRDAIRADLDAGLTPFFIGATLGTTSSGAVDPLEPIGRIAEEHNCWVHVDAAWAGSALVCEEHRWMLKGIEHASSFSFNPHKWLLTNFDCSLMWLNGRTRRDDLISAMSIVPEYLRNQASDDGAVIDYRDWHVPLGRRFRALKLWFVLRHYGASGLRAHIRLHCRLAERLERVMRADDRVELLAPRSLSLICFAVRGSDFTESEQLSRELLRRVNDSGKAYLTHTTLPLESGGSRYAIRFAIGSTLTTQEHVQDTWRLISETIDDLLRDL